MEDFEKIYVDGVFVIEVNLNRSTINEAIAFGKMVEEEINSGHTKLVIDLSKCDYIDSTFFGAIIKALGMMTDQGYKLKVVKPSISGEDIFTSTNTLRLFDIYKTREEAIKSFEEDIQPESDENFSTCLTHIHLEKKGGGLVRYTHIHCKII